MELPNFAYHAAEFPVNATLAQALPEFYKRYDLGADGGMSQNTVKIVFGKGLTMYIPNIDDRRKVVLRHDIHHIVTGYKSDFRGETEIGAWEIASGCASYWVALVLNLSSMAMGFWFNLPRMFAAFVRGRRTLNLYANTIGDDAAQSMTISDLRTTLGLDANKSGSATFGEWLSFFGWMIAAAICSLLWLLAMPVMAVYSVVVALRKK